MRARFATDETKNFVLAEECAQCRRVAVARLRSSVLRTLPSMLLIRRIFRSGPNSGPTLGRSGIARLRVVADGPACRDTNQRRAQRQQAKCDEA